MTAEEHLASKCWALAVRLRLSFESNQKIQSFSHELSSKFMRMKNGAQINKVCCGLKIK